MGRHPKFEGAPKAKLEDGRVNPEYAKLSHVREGCRTSFKCWYENNREKRNAERREKYRVMQNSLLTKSDNPE